MNPVTVGLIGVGILMFLFVSGLELSLCMMLVGFVGFAYLRSLDAACNLMAKDFYNIFVSYGFSVVPLFMFMGQLAFNAGIARQLYDTTHRFAGHIPGGLAIATVVGATMFKAVCGSSAATTATFGSVAIPEMDRFGYARKLSTGIVASVGTLGILIPPSIALIVFGIVSQQSIGKLFLGGLIPGLMLAFFFILVIYGWCRINPSIGPRAQRYSWKERTTGLPEIIWPILVFVVVVGGMLYGFFTPTEAGAIGACAVTVLVLITKRITFKGFTLSVKESLRSACMITCLILGSTVLGHFIAVTAIPQIAAQWIVALPFPRTVIMILICFVYLLGGSVIDDMAFVILATPIFFPAVQKLGFDPIWFLITIAVTIAIGCVIPPVALNVFIVKNITKEPLGLIYSGVYPFLISLVMCAVLLFIFPSIITWLPNVMGG